MVGTRPEHALTTERGWKDYGRASANKPDLHGEFTFLWANLVRHQAGFDHHDRERFREVFMSAAKDAAA